MKKAFLALFVLLVHTNFSFAQRKLIEKFFSNKSNKNRNIRVLALPALAYAQETGLEMGAVSIISFYADKKDTLNRPSTISANATFTTKKQLNLVVKPDIWLKSNEYHISGTLRYKDFPFNFYGLGDETLQQDEDAITLKWAVASGDIERKITEGLYAGVNIGYEHYSYQDKVADGIFEAMLLPKSGQVFYIGPSMIFDNRNTNTYTTKGSYARINYSLAPRIGGGNGFKGGFIRVDLRQFAEINSKVSTAFNFTYQGVQGKNPPFYLFPQLGNDQIMRGYYTGRYRDRNLGTLTGELRYRFMARLGIAGFFGLGSSFGDTHDFKWNKIKPSYGAGIRYFADPARGLTIRADYGIGEQRPGEKRQQGFYLSLAEAF